MLPTKKLELCPFTGNQSIEGGCPFSGKQFDEPVKTLDKKKKNKGGCPVMTSEKKRNPLFEIQEPTYEIAYLSPFQYMLDNQPFLFDTKKKRVNRERFDSYPIFIKHSLFHDEEQMLKVRKLDISQRFFIYDQFREQGNKAYFNKNYELALRHYERALSCYLWLEIVEDEREKQKLEEESKEVPDDYQNLKDKKTKEIRRKYRNLLTVFDDDNTILKGTEDNQDDIFDREMKDSLIFTAYLNIAATYTKMSHFSVAKQALQWAQNIKRDHSQALFRLAQCIVTNKASTFDELLEAQQHIEEALQLYKTEKLFTQEKKMLQSQNLHNVPEIYERLRTQILERIDSRKQWETEQIEFLFDTIKEYEENERDILADGRIPEEDYDFIPQTSSSAVDVNWIKDVQSAEHQEFEIVREIIIKYYQVLEFHGEQKRDDQIKIAIEQLQEVLGVYHPMSFFLFLNDTSSIFRSLVEKYQINLEDPKTMKRLLKICREKVRDLFEQGQYNYEIYKHALADYFKKRKEKQERKEKKQKMKQKLEDEIEEGPQKQTSIFSTDFCIQFILCVVIFALSTHIFKNTKFVEFITKY